MVAFGVLVTYLLTSGDLSTSPELKNLFNLLVPAIFLFAIVIANAIARRQLNAIDKSDSLESKLKKYQTVMLIRLAALEVAALFSSAAVLITGQMYYLAGTLVAMILFYTVRPSVGNMVNDLSLSQGEKMQLEA